MAVNSSYNLAKLEDTLDEYLTKKAPALPAKWIAFIVKFLPWVVLIFFVLTLPALLVLLGISSLVIPFGIAMGGPAAGLGVAAGFWGLVGAALLVVTLILEALALPGLFKQQRKAWRLLYYLALINGVINILSLNISGLVGTLLSLYILFQIKTHYK